MTSTGLIGKFAISFFQDNLGFSNGERQLSFFTLRYCMIFLWGGIMDEKKNAQEKRKHARKNVKITALLKMGIYLNGRGFAKDISSEGMCLVAPTIFRFIKPLQVQEHIGTHLRILFPSQSFTVNGTLVRIDTKKGEGAITVLNTSDDTLWQQLCSE